MLKISTKKWTADSVSKPEIGSKLLDCWVFCTNSAVFVALLIVSEGREAYAAPSWAEPTFFPLFPLAARGAYCDLSGLPMVRWDEYGFRLFMYCFFSQTVWFYSGVTPSLPDIDLLKQEFSPRALVPYASLFSAQCISQLLFLFLRF